MKLQIFKAIKITSNEGNVSHISAACTKRFAFKRLDQITQKIHCVYDIRNMRKIYHIDHISRRFLRDIIFYFIGNYIKPFLDNTFHETNKLV